MPLHDFFVVRLIHTSHDRLDGADAPSQGFASRILLAWGFVVAAVLVAPGFAQVEIPPASQRTTAETLEQAWQVALRGDHRLEAGQWNVASAQSSWAAARAERMPSLTLGADYYALSDQPTMQVNLAPLPIVAQQPLLDRDSIGAHGIVTQPIYTSGRISSGIAAAESQVSANRADLCRMILDVKMNVAESYVAVLSATRFVEVTESKVASLTAHGRDVTSLFEKGARIEERLSRRGSGLGRCQAKIARCGQQVGTGPRRLQPGFGTRLDGKRASGRVAGRRSGSDANGLTAQAMQQRPELATLASQARALQQQAESERAKTGPQVQVQGGYRLPAGSLP